MGHAVQDDGSPTRRYLKKETKGGPSHPLRLNDRGEFHVSFQDPASRAVLPRTASLDDSACGEVSTCPVLHLGRTTLSRSNSMR